MRQFLCLALVAVTAAACATDQGPVSTVDEGPASQVSSTVTAADARVLAGAMAGAASRRVRGSIRIIEAPGVDPIAPELASALRANGGVVAAPGAESSHRLSYRVGDIDGGTVVRMALDSDLIAQPFGRVRGGSLRPLGPVTVVETASR